MHCPQAGTTIQNHILAKPRPTNDNVSLLSYVTGIQSIMNPTDQAEASIPNGGCEQRSGYGKVAL
jgi:hypothetical protein